MQFLNVDLEIKSRASLAPLIDALGNKVVVQYQEAKRSAHFASLEVERYWRKTSPDIVINAFCDLLDALPPAASRAWKRAHMKTFDIGIDTLGARSSVISISTESTKRIAALGGSVTFTAYGQMAEKLEIALTVVIEGPSKGRFISHFEELPEIGAKATTVHEARAKLFEALKKAMENRRSKPFKAGLTQRGNATLERIRLVAA